MRRTAAAGWDDWCDSQGFRRPMVVAGSVPVFLRYPVLVDPEMKRDTSWATEALGINVGVWFATHVHPREEPVLGCPNADEAVARCVNFPCLFHDPDWPRRFSRRAPA
jgi:hypothetical protein